MSKESPTKSPIGSSQHIDKPPQPKQPQSITLPVTELLKWQKKSKQLTLQVKTLTTQNQSLKQQLTQAKKKQDQRRKNDNVVQGLEQTIKQLQRILDDNMTAMNKIKKENTKLQDELNMTKQMLGSRESELVGLRETSSDYFLLKQEVNRLENQVTNLKTSESQIEKLRKELEDCRFIIGSNEEKLTEMSNKVNRKNGEIDELTKSKEELEGIVKAAHQELYSCRKEKEIFDGRVKEYEMRVDDLEKENQLSMVKYVQEIKDLKELLTSERTLKEKYQGKVKQQQQVQQFKGTNPDLQSKDSQYLLTKIQQLQTQNAVAKYMMNETSSKIALVQQKLKTRSEALISLTKEYAQRWPNLDESDGLQYVEHEILKEATNDAMGMVDLVERCVIENLRLKYMVETIGSEYNNELRKKEFS